MGIAETVQLRKIFVGIPEVNKTMCTGSRIVGDFSSSMLNERFLTK